MARSSVTTTDPIWRLSISVVASVSDASTSQVTGGDDISSCTAVGMGCSSMGPGGPCRRSWSGSLSPSSVTPGRSDCKY